MREHQIVFSLKPEQYQELQRQAKAAGARSVGMFVRQRILSTLGLDKDANPLPRRSGEKDPDWRFISYELRRLHRELKMLIEESGTTTSLQTANADLDGALAQMAATIDGAPSTRDEFLSGTVPVLKENFLADGAPLAPAPADSPDASFTMEVTYQPPGSPDLSIPATVSANPTPQALPREQIKPVLTQRDELEVLADRAFAISPRLGSIDPTPPPEALATRSFSDTLNDLLDQGLISQTTEREGLIEGIAGEVEDAPRFDEDIEVGSIDEVSNREVATESAPAPKDVRVDQLFEATDEDKPAPSREEEDRTPQPPTDERGGPPPVPPPKRRRS